MAKRTVKANETDVMETAVETTETVETKIEDKPKAVKQTAREVVAETIHQLGIFSDYIYHAKHKGVDLVIENMGYGDIYVSEEGLAQVGNHEQRLLFQETRTFKGADKLYMKSSSQPVVQILEIK